MTEPLDFFLSYSRRDFENAEIYLTKFLEDLTKEIRLRRASSKGEEVAFFDQRTLIRGSDWKESLLDALQTSRTLVCLYSPNYFESEYCGKEWQLMHLRRMQYQGSQQAAGRQDAKLPPLIKPIRWILPFEPDFSRMSDAVGATQYSAGDLSTLINTKGLLHVIKRCESGSEFKNEYLNFIEALAIEILHDAAKYPVGPYEGKLEMESIQNAFVRPPERVARNSIDPKPPKPTLGPSYVHFVYVAANPEEVRQKGRRRLESYASNGGKEWQPYNPPEESYIATLATNVASTKGLNFIPGELAISENLDNEIEKKESQHNLVILFVDGWTAGIDPYRQWLQKIDRRKFFNCSILTPWNPRDAETVNQSDLLMQHLQEAFPFNTDSEQKSSIYYCGQIKSEKELRKKLQEVLIKLRNKVRKKIPLKNPIQSDGLTVIDAANPGAAT
jgi:FxsC-like protein